MPKLIELSRPKGYPKTTASSPTLMESESPNDNTGSARSVSILSSARSTCESDGMDDESRASTTLRLLRFTAGLGIALGDDTDLDNGWTRIVGESDVGTAHKVELGFCFVLRGVTPDRRGWRY